MNIKTLLPALAAALLLSACGSIVPKPQTDLFTIAKFESDNTIVSQISHPERQIIAYYDNNHLESAKPAKGGYYRMLLGRTAEGRAVIQDFYQDNGMRQISPVIIPDDTKLKLSTPLEIGLNGKMAFYSRKGRLQSIGLYENGRVVEEWTYDLKGRLINHTSTTPSGDSSSHAVYGENGKLLHHFKYQQNTGIESKFYRPDGSLIYTIRYDVSEDSTAILDARGRPASQELQDEAERFLRPRMDEFDELEKSDE